MALPCARSQLPQAALQLVNFGRKHVTMGRARAAVRVRWIQVQLSAIL